MASQQDEGGLARADGAHHPLDPLSGDEIRQAVGIFRGDGRATAAMRFVSVSLHEPPKNAAASLRPGQAPGREAFIVALEPRERMTYEAVVSLTQRCVLSLRPVPGVRAPVTLGEYAECERLVRADQDFRDGLKRRGIHDPDQVLAEAWGLGGFTRKEDEGRRLVWALCFYRASPGDNPYAKPIHGLHAVVDLDEMMVVRVEDAGAVPLPPGTGDYTADGTARRAGLMPPAPDAAADRIAGAAPRRPPSPPGTGWWSTPTSPTRWASRWLQAGGRRGGCLARSPPRA